MLKLIMWLFYQTKGKSRYRGWWRGHNGGSWVLGLGLTEYLGGVGVGGMAKKKPKSTLLADNTWGRSLLQYNIPSPQHTYNQKIPPPPPKNMKTVNPCCYYLITISNLYRIWRRGLSCRVFEAWRWSGHDGQEGRETLGVERGQSAGLVWEGGGVKRRRI